MISSGIVIFRSKDASRQNKVCIHANQIKKEHQQLNNTRKLVKYTKFQEGEKLEHWDYLKLTKLKS
jgi:hypothetical protein